jgi:hypothetical protein
MSRGGSTGYPLPGASVWASQSIDDSAKRAAEIATAKILTSQDLLEPAFLTDYASLRNGRGETIGRLSACFEL